MRDVVFDRRGGTGRLNTWYLGICFQRRPEAHFTCEARTTRTYHPLMTSARHTKKTLTLPEPKLTLFFA